MYENLSIVTENDQPYGIREKSGFLFFFAPVQHFPGQDERYQKELRERWSLARYLLTALKIAADEK